MHLRALSATALAALLVLTACGDADPDLATDTADEVEEPDESMEEPDPEPDEQEVVDEDAADEDTAAEDDTDADPDTTTDDAAGDAGDDGPQPDEAALADPCAGHEDREMDLFIELVAPVDEQIATDTVRIVGCSNVPEANIVWHLLDGDGVLLDEGFTTATCGTGCVGEFDDEVPLDAAAGEPVAYLQVFTPNLADEGPDQLELVERIVVRG